MDVDRTGGVSHVNEAQLKPLHPVAAHTPAERAVASVAVGHVRDIVVVDVFGELDMLTAPGLAVVLAEQTRRRPRVVVVKLSEVSFLGSSGLATLVSAHHAGVRTGVPLRLAAPSRMVRRTLRLTGMTGWFDIYESVQAAVAL